MKEEIELYDMIYKYIDDIDIENVHSIGNSQWRHEFKINDVIKNPDDPYDEENWGDDINIKVICEGEIGLYMNNERICIDRGKLDKLNDLIGDKKGIEEKKNLLKF